jgi:alpha/beta superfamily hydrolase
VSAKHPGTQSKHGSIESLTLAGEAGALEALLNLGAPDAKYAALVCHPHPLFGGTMHNKVVYHAMKTLNAFGFPVLRFNFRGVGTSAGEHDEGRGEIADARVALNYLAERFALPILFAGYSFGAAVGVRAAVADARVNALILLGAPLNAEGREYSYEALETSALPKLLLSGTRDQFASPAQLEQVFARAAEPKRLVLIPEADHFFGGHMEELRAALRSWVGEVTGVAAPPAV